jgi:choline kinase
VRAVLLAAGRGHRLGRPIPKCLVSIAGRTLLQRHIENVAACGLTDLCIVVGFERERIEAELSRLTPHLGVELLQNSRYDRGNLLSLHLAADRLEGGGIWMDADVFYPRELLRRLVTSTSPHENCLLLDPRSQETGEEMMVGVRAGRAVRVARRIGPGWDLAGETVGFTRVGAEGARVMRRLLAEEVAAGRDNTEYEAALDRAFAEVPFGFERVDDLPWTEIDFEEDVARAQAMAATMPGM